VNFADISVRISSPAANSTSISIAGIVTVWSVSERSLTSIHELTSSQNARWANADGSKLASSSRLSTRSTFLLNCEVTPAESL
jgi:hypothetical protein